MSKSVREKKEIQPWLFAPIPAGDDRHAKLKERIALIDKRLAAIERLRQKERAEEADLVRERTKLWHEYHGLERS